MPKLKVLSGAEVVRILSIFGFKVASQRVAISNCDGLQPEAGNRR
jgi:hypothetical protein